MTRSNDPQPPSASPAPAPVVCAHCGCVVGPADRECPACGTRLPGAPGAPAPGSGIAQAVLLVLWLAMIAVWIWPAALEHVGLGELARWLREAPARRFALWIPITTVLIVSGMVQQRWNRGRMRRDWAPLARVPGTEIVDGPREIGVETASDGLQVRSRVRSWLLTLDTCVEGSSRSTRLRARVAPARPLTLLICQQSRLLKAVTSPGFGGLLLALGRSGYSNSVLEEQRRKQALDDMAIMVGPEIPTGDPEVDHALMLKSSDADGAKRLMGALRAPLLRLCRPGGFWSITLAADPAKGASWLEFREMGVVRDAARLEMARDAVSQLLERLAADGAIADRAPAADA